ncbi:MAG TPA: DUF2911 domain-containing protein [Chitinophagaceae bacterium]|nr:DUF2911 domain-containing protein [Chitinophagaceae bacterium]
MITPARFLFCFLLPVVFLACQNKKNNPVKNNNPIKKIDTGSVVKQEEGTNADASVDISPMDMSYYPVDYPKLKMTNSIKVPPVARIIYSRPHLQGRKLFHDLLKYGEPWRLGANEATEIQFYKDVTIQNKKIAAGRYILYCIPEKDKWTIVLNSNIDTWGLKIDSTKDLQHFEIPITTNNPLLEYFTVVFEKTATGANLLMAWDNIVAKLPINF